MVLMRLVNGWYISKVVCIICITCIPCVRCIAVLPRGEKGEILGGSEISQESIKSDDFSAQSRVSDLTATAVMGRKLAYLLLWRGSCVWRWWYRCVRIRPSWRR